MKEKVVYSAKPRRTRCSYKVLKVLEVLELDFLKLKSWKTPENRHIFEEVLEKYFHF